MRDIKDIIEFYKTEKISDHSFKMEITRALSPLSHVSVDLDLGTTASTTNSSYIAALIPEKVNGELFSTLILDKYALINVLGVDDIDFILKTSENFSTFAAKMLNDFIVRNAESEVSFNDCILLYISIYKALCEKYATYPYIKELMVKQTIDLEKLRDVELAIETKNEKSESIVEYILVHKLLPEFALRKAEELFQQLNRGSLASGENPDVPVKNYWYSKTAALSTGIINPEYHQDLDPNYIPNH